MTPHTCLQGPIEPLDNARLRFIVVRRNMMRTVLVSNFCNDRLNNSVTLSVCNVFGAPLLSNCVKAATNEAANLFFSGTHQASLETTLITISMNVVPSLTFLNRDMSTRLACHCWFGPPTTPQQRLKRRLTGLRSVYVSCSDNQRSMSCSGTTLRRAATPP